MPSFKSASTTLCLFLISALPLAVPASASPSPSPQPSKIDTWCGKAYKAGDPRVEPGGWLSPPPLSPSLLVDFQAYPQMNIYLAEEREAFLVVDVAVGYEVGEGLCGGAGGDGVGNGDAWILRVRRAGMEGGLEIAQATVKPGSTGNMVQMSLQSLPPRMEPYELEVDLDIAPCSQVLKIKTSLTRLPTRTDGGSVVRLDHLHGGLQVQDGAVWKPFFPFSFYVGWGNYLIDPSNQDAFLDLGFNIVHPTPGGGDTPFELDLFAAYVDKLDGSPQRLMYDFRWTYKNDTLVARQVNELKAHKSLLLWYTTDEPDGYGDPLDAPAHAANLIRNIDPYHPISLVLNCANFHFAKYTRSTPIILTDPYPIAVNMSWSKQWNTTCDEGYGDCGCDNCKGGFRDVTERIDGLRKFDHWLGNQPLGVGGTVGEERESVPPKSFWGVPQVFGGSEYWTRPPTADEEAVMVWLFINHGAKGIVGWNFPTTSELTRVMAAMAKVVTDPKVTALLLGHNPRKLQVSANEGVDVDAAAWIVNNEMLISVVHLGLEDEADAVTVHLPAEVEEGSAVRLWPPASQEVLMHKQDGDIGEMHAQSNDGLGMDAEDAIPQGRWFMHGNNAISKGTLPAMAVSIFVVRIREDSATASGD